MNYVLFFLCFYMNACGMQHRVSGQTYNEVYAQGEVDVEITLKLDLSTCEEFHGTQKLSCIESITGVFESLGDLSKILVCPESAEVDQCDLLSSILDKAGEVK